jgi:ketoreductase RED1
MHDSSGEQYNAAAVIGGGLIGASWTAVFLSNGMRVAIHDPRPDIEPVVRAGLRTVAPTLKELGMDVANLVEDTGRLIFEDNVAAAVADADVVQENAPERLELKQQLGRRSRRRPSKTRYSPARAPHFPPPPSPSGCASPSV